MIQTGWAKEDEMNLTGSERIQSISPTDAPGKFGGTALLFGQGSNKVILTETVTVTQPCCLAKAVTKSS